MLGTRDAQSSFAIICSLAKGTKLSMSSPFFASSPFTWSGTSLWFSWGAIESSARQLDMNKTNH